jgi:hypothetical protein
MASSGGGGPSLPRLPASLSPDRVAHGLPATGFIRSGVAAGSVTC